MPAKTIVAEQPRIVFSHSDFLIVYKPAHLLVHPTRPNKEPTLLSWLQEKYPDSFLALVNRLDRETSGLVIVATTPESASTFGKMSMQRVINKEYQAIIFGKMATDYGKIEASIGRLGISETNPVYLKQGVLANGGAIAITEFWLCKKNESFSFLQLKLHTGRLHQIRVHLASIGHPLVGDKIYGSNPNFYLEFIKAGWTDAMEKELLLNRHALHAFKLKFSWKEQLYEWINPLPTDLKDLQKKLNLASD